MSWEPLLMLLTLAGVIYALARNTAGPDVVFLTAAAWLMTLSLLSPRFPTPREAASVFGNEGLLTVAVHYVVVIGLAETGALAIVAERVLGRPRSVPAAQLRMMLPVTGTSALLNNTPVVAMFLPVAEEWCRRRADRRHAGR